MDNLRGFLEPKSIMIIGASNHKEKVGGILMEKAIKSKSKIIPINPNHKELVGLRCYRDILDYSGQVDLAIIALPKDFVFEALEKCGKKGIRNVIIISAGFSEVGDKEGERKLKEIATKYRIRFLGPNCFGICNPTFELDLTFSKTTPKEGSIAFISQSGALWSFIADLSIEKFGFSGFVSLGNMEDLEFYDFIDYFSIDKKTKSIVLYIEKLKDGKKFMELCKRTIAKGEKIFAVHVGETKEGKKAAFSHTASIASDYLIYKGMFKQVGVELCSGLEEAFEKASSGILREKITKGVKIGKEVKIITNAGGAGALLSDCLSKKGFKILEVKDILGTALAEDYKKELEKTKEKEIIVILTGQAMSEIEKTAEVIVDFKKKTRKNLVALFLGGGSMKKANEIFEENKVDYFNTLKGAGESL
jgi:acetyltransferase